MSTKLYPELTLSVEAQQHLGEVRGQDEAAAGQGLGAAVTVDRASLHVAHEDLVLAPEAHLGGRHRRPLLEPVEDLARTPGTSEVWITGSQQ